MVDMYCRLRLLSQTQRCITVTAARPWSTCTVDCVCCHKLRDVFQSSLTLMAMLTVNRNYLFVNGDFRFCRHSVSVRPSVRPSVCLSVCPSVSLYVTFVRSVETKKNIFEMFSPAGSHTILVFPYEMSWQQSDGNRPNGGLECRWGTLKYRYSTNIWLCDQ